VEIIKRGQPPSEKRYEGTCHTCGTVVSFKAAEAEELHDPRDHSVTYKVVCPVCSGSIFGYGK
jgi:hypothetical protein